MVKKSMQVGSRARVSILHNNEACAGVLHKNRRRPSGNARFGNNFLYLASDLIRSFSRGTDREAGSMGRHTKDHDMPLAVRSSHSIVQIRAGESK